MRPTQAEMTMLVSYDPVTGIMKWMDGRQITCTNDKRYLVFKSKGRQFYAHRVAWLLMTGQWPQDVDHINQIRSDNRWCNLREASRSQNAINRSIPAGVTFDKRLQRFEARIQKLGRRKRLGYFASFEEAKAARLNAERKLFGDFAPAK